MPKPTPDPAADSPMRRRCFAWSRRHHAQRGLSPQLAAQAESIEWLTGLMMLLLVWISSLARRDTSRVRGEVQVTARIVDGGVFELRVLDDGAGLAPGVPEGVGLANSRERLRHPVGERAELRVGPRADGAGTESRLRIQPDSGGSQTG